MMLGWMLYQLGSCRFLRLLLHKVLPADALVLATPLYWYGIAGQLKIFIGRSFCYIKSDYPGSETVRTGLVRKKIVLAVTSEELYPGAIVGITAQVQELARYLHGELVGMLRGIGNSRGEIKRDPARPLEQAYALGAREPIRLCTGCWPSPTTSPP